MKLSQLPPLTALVSHRDLILQQIAEPRIQLPTYMDGKALCSKQCCAAVEALVTKDLQEKLRHVEEQLRAMGLEVEQ